MKPWGFPGGTSGKEPACQCRRHERCRFDPWVGKVPWRGQWQPPPLFLPEEFHGQRSLVGLSPQGCTQLDTTEATYRAQAAFVKQFQGFYSDTQIFEEASQTHMHKHGPCSIVYHSKIWKWPKCPLIGGKTTEETNNNLTVKNHSKKKKKEWPRYTCADMEQGVEMLFHKRKKKQKQCIWLEFILGKTKVGRNRYLCLYVPRTLREEPRKL